jgi:exodeoxyribonuclease VII large subunit
MLPAPDRLVLSVSEVARTIRDLLESSFPRIVVRGEVTNLSRPQSGHLYFSLFDDSEGGKGSRLTSAQLPCVLWRSQAARLRTPLENGHKVIVSGRIGVYEPRGTYQLIGDRVEPAGLGDLQRLFEELKERLRQEGLFDAARKRPLPYLPQRIGLITSSSGAAIRDVLRVLYRRHPRAWVRIAPVRVQGQGAVEEIARAVRFFQTGAGQADVIVLARGGGSLEDLWAFNDEEVARALAASRIPTVSAVGHEVDFSISDFVADARAQTPTHAAELLVPDFRDLSEKLRILRRRLQLAIENERSTRAAQLSQLLKRRPFREPQTIVQEWFERCDDLAKEMKFHLYKRWSEWEDALTSRSGRLEALNPLKVIERGYSLTTDLEGRIVRDAADLDPGQGLRIRLARGGADVQVTGLSSDRKPAAGSSGLKKS